MEEFRDYQEGDEIPVPKKKLVVLLGAPAGGKSKWISDNNLRKHTLSADDLRLLFSPDISKGISQKYNKEVWELLYRLVAVWAQDSVPLIILDNCHCGEKYFSKYAEIVKSFDYQIIGVNFHQPLETHLLLNQERPRYKIVPPDIIANMHKNAENFLNQNRKWHIISPMEARDIIRGIV